ncbi:MAG: response regulator [Spirochaetota bacterium]
MNYDVIQSLTVPACVINQHGELIFQNSEYTNLFKTDTENITLDDEHEFYNEYRRRLALSYNRALEGHASKSFIVIKSVHGDKIPVEIYLYPLTFSGNEHGIVMLLNRVDDRVVSFDRKLHSGDSGSPLYDFAPFPVLIINENLDIVNAGSHALHMLGLGLEQLQSSPELFFSLFSSYAAERIKKAVYNITHKEKSFVRLNDIRLISASGNEHFGNIVMYPLSRTSNDNDVEFIFEETTRQKALENKLSQMNKVRIFSDMTKGLLHSFNNIINVIINRTQMLQQLTEKRNLHEGLSAINDSALDAATQIRRIQEFINPDPGDVESTQDIIELIRDAIEFATIHFKVENKEKGRNIYISKQYFTRASVTGNMKILREIIVSMIFRMASAIAQEGTVEIILRREEDMILSVSVASQYLDDEKNIKMENYIPEVELRRISEKINVRILEEDSSDGISYKAIIPSRMIQEEKERRTENQPPKIRDCDILIVEDEPALNEILYEVFDFMGNRVVIHDSGESAIEELKNHTFDIVIADYGLNGMNGIEFLTKVREHAENSINVLLSGWVLENIAMYGSSIDLFLQKPFQLDTLLKRIGSIMEENRTA